jgi:hypothetical protein
MTPLNSRQGKVTKTVLFGKNEHELSCHDEGGLQRSGAAAAILADGPFRIEIFDTWNAMFRGIERPTGWYAG